MYAGDLEEFFRPVHVVFSEFGSCDGHDSVDDRQFCLSGDVAACVDIGVGVRWYAEESFYGSHRVCGFAEVFVEEYEDVLSGEQCEVVFELFVVFPDCDDVAILECLLERFVVDVSFLCEVEVVAECAVDRVAQYRDEFDVWIVFVDCVCAVVPEIAGCYFSGELVWLCGTEVFCIP